MSISGPFVSNDGGYLIDGFQSQKVSYRQSRPYVQPLPYSHWSTRWASNRGLSYSLATNWRGEWGSSSISALQAKAYDRFYNHVGSRASFLMNALELPRTMKMVAERSLQLRRSISALHRGDIGSAVTELYPKGYRLSRSRQSRLSGKMAADGISSGWLELTFGWTPVIQDIYTGCSIISREFPGETIKSSATEQLSRVVELPGIYSAHAFGSRSVKMEGRLRVDNPNLFLANQLGLINPAAVAWDAVPFSFVVDWFIPVNKFLTSLSNDIGCTIELPRTTFQLKFDGQCSQHLDGKPIHPWEGFSCREFMRTPGSFSRPGLFDRSKIPKPSLWLAATSLSLVVQGLQKR